MKALDTQVIIVGGGLAGLLIFWKLIIKLVAEFKPMLLMAFCLIVVFKYYCLLILNVGGCLIMKPLNSVDFIQEH